MASHATAGETQASARLKLAVAKMLGRLAQAWGRPEPDAGTVELYAEALLEPSAPGKPSRSPRLDAIPYATMALIRERTVFPAPAIVVQYVAKATRALFDQERETDANHARQRRRASGDHQGCHVCGARYVEVGPGPRVEITHDAQKHGWRDE